METTRSGPQPGTPRESPGIRPAEPPDLPVIGRLGALLVQTHHGFDPERFLAATPKTEEAYGAFIGTQLGKPGVSVLVAERAGVVLGYAYASVEGHKFMALRGPRVVLWTAERNQAAQRLFASAGFRQTMLEMTRELGGGGP
jgi:hypothetical protein